MNSDIATYFNDCCDTHGTSIHSVGWFNTYTQEQRFLMLTLIEDLTGSSILDLGCGQGALVSFLESQDIKPRAYEGLDISHKMVELASKTYPDHTFICGDFMSPDMQKQFDYILASGTFNYRVNDQETYIQSMISKMFSLCKKAVSFNLLSSCSPESFKKDQDIMYFYDPVRIFEYCLTLTPYVAIKQNYLPNDFTVYMHKNTTATSS